MNNTIIDRLRTLDAGLNREFGVSRIGIFGSYARGEERGGSDIDLLVEFNKPVNLFEFSRLRSFLSERLGLATPNALKKL